MAMPTFEEIIANEINELKRENNRLTAENNDLKAKLDRATEQWNIWCAAYQELAEKY